MKFCVKRNRNNHQEVNEFFSNLYRKVYCSRGEYKNSEYPYNNYDFDFLHYPKGGRHNTKVVFKHKQVGYTELTLSAAKKLFMKEEKVYTLRDLRLGKVGLILNQQIGDLEFSNLKRVLKFAFPNDDLYGSDYVGYVFHLSHHNIWGVTPSNKFTLPVQTLDVFVKELDSLQTIVGYKAPYDMFNGKVKKGYVFTHIMNEYSSKKYYHELSVMMSIPAEIVEKWEPEYKCFVKSFTLHGPVESINLTVYKNGFHKDYGEDSFIDYSSMKEIIQPKKFKGGIEQVIDFVSIDGAQIDSNEIKQIVNYYEKHFLNGK